MDCIWMSDFCKRERETGDKPGHSFPLIFFKKTVIFPKRIVYDTYYISFYHVDIDKWRVMNQDEGGKMDKNPDITMDIHSDSPVFREDKKKKQKEMKIGKEKAKK